jgi:hypothetical protein
VNEDDETETDRKLMHEQAIAAMESMGFVKSDPPAPSAEELRQYERVLERLENGETEEQILRDGGEG